jgi:hypothetical protein
VDGSWPFRSCHPWMTRDRGGLLLVHPSQEATSALRSRCDEDLFRWSLLHELAFVYEDHAIGDVPGETHLVCDHHHRHPVAGEGLHHLKDLPDQLRVERRGWLVEEHHVGIHAQGACDRDPLLLSAGEPYRVLTCLVGDADTFQHPPCESQIQPHTPEGKMMLQMLAIIASAERDYIVKRHTFGRVAQWKRQAWIPSKGYPPGYVLDEDRRLRLSGPDDVEMVKKALRILADPEGTGVATATKLGAIGLSTPTLQANNGMDATLADARNPSQVVITLRKWGEPMRRGQYTVFWPNPFPGVKDFAGVSVEEHPDTTKYPNGALRFDYTLPLPEGGWADEATFDSIQAILGSPSTGGGTTHRHTPPLSGLFRFISEDFEHALLCDNGYILARRPHNPEAQYQGGRCRDRTCDLCRVKAALSR